MPKRGVYLWGAVGLLLATGGYYASAQSATGLLHMAGSPTATGRTTQTIHGKHGMSAQISTTTTQPAGSQGYALNDWSQGSHHTAADHPTKTVSAPAPTATQSPKVQPTHTASKAPWYAPGCTKANEAKYPHLKQSCTPAALARQRWIMHHPHVQPIGWENISFDDNTQWHHVSSVHGMQIWTNAQSTQGVFVQQGPSYGGTLTAAVTQHIARQFISAPLLGFKIVSTTGSYPGRDGMTVHWQAAVHGQTDNGWVHETHTGELMQVAYHGVNWPLYMEKPSW